jgi:predicted dehydrogenase
MTNHGGAGYRLGVAVVGAGYWGPNLIRNFSNSPTWDLHWVCDLDEERAHEAVGRHSTVRVTRSLETVLSDPLVDAVAIATPAATHYRIASACLSADKHLLVEKPLARSVEEGEMLVEEAERRGLTLMCDHTYCYTPPVRHVRRLIADGSIGQLQYLDSVRINLGLVQPDIDVFWDLAPHDLSILDFVLPEGCQPTSVSALGADPIGAGRTCVGYLTLPLLGGAIAHLHVNWLSPTKIRRTIIAGSQRMVVWDDLKPSQRLSMYDRGVDIPEGLAEDDRRKVEISYRIGDMVAPALPEREALQDVSAELFAAILEGRPPLTDGHSGLRILRILEAASRSVIAGGSPVSLEVPGLSVAAAS